MSGSPTDGFGFDLPDEKWLQRVGQAVRTPPPETLADSSDHRAATDKRSQGDGTQPDSHSQLRADATASLPTAAVDTCADTLPQQIGRYRILGEIGRGGMGVVYEAEQPRPQRTVALKVMRPGYTGASALRRFELEAHVLGRLQHPGIAQIYEAGIAQSPDGIQPYFAMELIRGSALREFAADANLGIRDRLRLMATICDAVHYAHQHGVIHRDLKPGNILVDQNGHPKILDFGVARATDCDMQVTTVQTDVGQLIGTLQYMSPEQVAANPSALDIRSDVFALGVIAYELLTDRLPFDLRGKMIHEAARIIREDEPSRLSTHHRLFRGDVETMVAKAMAKDKSMRYGSAAEFAEDIRRHLRDEPIVARPPSTTYQLRKFARRHRAFVGGVVAVFLALTGGLIASTMLYIQSETRRREAERQEQRADAEAAAAKTEADKARMIQRFLQDMLAEADPRRTQRHEITMRDVLEAAGRRLEGQFVDQPEVKAALEQTIGEAFYGLFDLEPAIRHLSAATTLWRELGQAETTQFADVLQKLGESYGYLGKPEGVPIMREALAVQTGALGEQHPKTASAKQHVGFVLFRSGITRGGDEELFEEAERMVAEALTVFRSHPDATDAQLGRCWHGYGVIIGFRGRLDEALSTTQDALEFERRALGVHPYTWDCLDDLAMFQERAGRFQDAIDSYRELVTMGVQLFGPADDKIADRLQRFGDVQKRIGDLANAEQSFAQALDTWRRRNEVDGERAMRVRASLVDVLTQRGDRDRALALLHEGVEMLRGEPDGPGITAEVSEGSAGQLAGALASHGAPETAEAILRELVDARVAEYGELDPRTLAAVFELGRVLREIGKPDEAVELFRSGWLTQRDNLGPDDQLTLHWMCQYAGSLHDAGRPAEAEVVYREAYLVRKNSTRTEDLSHSAVDMALVLRDQQRYEEALPFAREAVDIRTRIRGRYHSTTTEAESLLVAILRQLGELDEALAIRRERYNGVVDARETAVSDAFEYAALLRTAGQSEKAATLFHDGWQALQADDGTTPLNGLVWMGNYAACLLDVGRADEAEPLFRQAYEGYRELDRNAPDLARSAHDMAIVSARLGRVQDAITYALEALEYREAHRSADDPSLLGLKRYLAALLKDAGRYQEAESILLEVLTALTESKEAPAYKKSVRQLIELYREWQKPEQAALWQERLSPDSENR